jgi:hypothetical protein
MTGKRLGIRTDSLNIFEKDIVEELQIHGASLVVEELEKNLPNLKIVSFDDTCNIKKDPKKVSFNLPFINKLI